MASKRGLSLLTANFNNASFLRDFLLSVAESTRRPDEIIFVDDCSKDDSVDIATREAARLGLPLKVIRLERNVGFANALNIGLDHVTGELVGRIDPDDVLSPRRLELQEDYLRSHPDVGVVGSNVAYFRNTPSDPAIKSNFPLTHDEIRSRYRIGAHGLVHGAITIRTEALAAHRYRQEWVPAEEYDIFSRLIVSGVKAANLPDALTCVRVHSRSVTHALPYRTVRLTFELRRTIWGQRSSRLQIVREWLSRRWYRNALGADGIIRIWYLGLASLLNPTAAARRLFR